MNTRNALLILFIFVFNTLTFAQKSDTLQAPVTLSNDTLFFINNGFEGVSINERARLINSRLEKLLTEPNFTIDSLKQIDREGISRIYYADKPVLMVTDKDAIKAGVQRHELATQYFEAIKSAFIDLNTGKSFGNLFTQVLEVLGVICIVGFLIILINRLFRFLQIRLLKYVEWKLNEFQRRKKIEVSYTKRILPLISGLVKVIKLSLVILIIYLTLPVLFSIFPWTQPIADKLLTYVLNPLKNILLAALHYIPNLLTIIVIYLVTRYIIQLFHFLAEEVANGTIKVSKFYPDWAMPTFNIIRFLLYAFMFVVIFPYLPGSDSKIFQGVTVFIGVLFSLGSSSAIANIVSGVVLTYMRPFKLGDRVKIGDNIGDVIEKNLLVTRIRTIKNEDITIPNSTILSNPSTNYSSSSKSLGLILHTTITLTYDTPWKQINELMIRAALNTQGVLQQPAPFVLQTALNDFYVSYEINAYTELPQQMAGIYSELHKNLQDMFNEAGLEIMSPHVFAVRDGNTIQIPDSYKPKDYQKTGFKIEGNVGEK
ncbi:mechanosensitive ion channel family protein [Solitalea sp. MAHUQ-68]|uniref:Mechanosensitive ion channel family protein n=1 Tax=Solitalea agri TaxID=2953739 RepID=A0A9X2F9I0_9SPHI|nr:mechanosensitive ion channel family protein [Solitalea agri]MCO4294781.1 mechanosensitive ion channel family protein [Solitalea agri]